MGSLLSVEESGEFAHQRVGRDTIQPENESRRAVYRTLPLADRYVLQLPLYPCGLESAL